MIYTSSAKYRDGQTRSGRLNYFPLIFQIEVNDYFIFFKLFEKNLFNFFIFFKSRVGHLIYNLASLINRKMFSMKNVFLVLFSFIYPIIHINSIIKGDLFFY